jgi:hypothetical protein
MRRISFIAPDLRRLEIAAYDLIALFAFDELRPFRGITSLIDWRLYSHLSRVVIEGFYRGRDGTQLLMPLGRHLPQTCLLLVGLGSRETFGEGPFTRSLSLAFDTALRLGLEKLVISLPGRQEGVCPPSDAIEWFLTAYDAMAEEWEVLLIEPQGAQKAMLPSVERWRLRQLVP